VFRDQGTLLVGLHAIANGSENPMGYLEKPLAPRKLVRELEARGLDIYAAGYNQHLRNSIAHGHLRFLPNTATMRFRDFNPFKQGAQTFDETLSLANVAALYAKLDDTYIVFSTYWQIYLLPGAFRR